MSRTGKRIRAGLISPLAPPPGGIATWTRGLLEFAAPDPDTHIVHVNSAIRYRSIGNVAWTRRVLAGCLYSPALIVKAVATLVGKHIDVVHLCTSGSLGLMRDIVLLALFRIVGIPVVLHFRFGRLPSIALSRNWEAVLLRIACRLTRMAVVLDDASAEALRAMVPGCRVMSIPNPAWSITAASPNAVHRPETKTLLFVGHVIRAKGVFELVRSCCSLASHHDFRLDVIGPVEENIRTELRQIAQTTRDGSWLSIMGEMSGGDILARMAEAFAVILPSHTEGFPNVVLEAMMLGKPVIATPVGAIPQMLAHETAEPCGICVAVGDIDGLTAAIRSLLADPLLAAEYGRRARHRAVRQYSPGHVYSMYRALWRDCAAHRTPGWKQPSEGPQLCSSLDR